jgi:hypothetical protein
MGEAIFFKGKRAETVHTPFHKKIIRSNPIMRNSAVKLLAILAVAVAPLSVQAETVSLVEGGQTSVLFGNGALDSLGLDIADIVDGTISPGSLGPLSVAFPINLRDDATAPTTFEYGAMFSSFAGTIEHGGGVILTDADTGTESITVGAFTIAYDESRVGDDRTGFYVADNADVGEILFDLANPIIEAFDTSLVIAADILVSQELSDSLQGLGFISDSVAGTDAGIALVVADATLVPILAAAWLFGSALGLLAWVRRRV